MAGLSSVFKRAGRKAKKVAGAALGEKQAQTLSMWQERLARVRQAAAVELELMDRREDLYVGSREIQRGANSKSTAPTKQASYVRNIVSELIETQIDSNIPMPKVDPLNPEDEARALMIENTLRSDVNRLPVEYLNDEQERTNPIQGGSYFLIEWDNTIRTHTTVGDTWLSVLHPKQVFFQPGAKDPRKSEWAICQFSVPREYVKNRWDVDVEDEPEETPAVGIASSNGLQPGDTDNVTLNLAFYRNEQRGVGLYAWVNDTEVADFEDYFARRMDVCAACGKEKDGPVCVCGSKKFKAASRDHEELTEDIPLPDGRVIPALSPKLDEYGAPVVGADGQPVMERTRVPYYKPNRLPIVLRKNVSVYGKLLGESDVDRIADQQERIKKLGTKMDEKLLKGGSVLAINKRTSFKMNDEEMKVLRVDNEQETASIKAFTLQPNITYDSAEIDKAYMAAKQTLGITDSFQGQPDKTATSGIAKQIAASQSAGRLESKRRMKDAAWADVYQLLFMFKLAYADEPRPFMARQFNGQRSYGVFNRYAFLKQDAAGQWYYDDQFLFSVDNSGGLANNREAMWQEARMNYQQGAFGQVGTPQSLVMFWTLMESLHYPKAADLKAMAEQMQAQAEQQQQMQMQQQAQAVQMDAQVKMEAERTKQMQMQARQPMPPGAFGGSGRLEGE
jgi:hypothetical protein